MMMRQTILVLALATCVLAATLPVRRLTHSGPFRKFGRAHGRIIGGQDATQGQFPYQVSVQVVMIGIASHNCGGSVISDSAVLTAAHCVTNLGHNEVVAGEHDLKVEEGTEQRIRVTEQIQHPDYREVGSVAINDIAVFLLQSALSLNSNVQVISLPTANSVPSAGSTAVLSGWGVTSSGIFPHHPNILQWVDVVIVDNDECAELLGNSPLNANNVCTGPVTGGISICSGDSGGPLVQDGGVIGVVSWGVVPCGKEGAPSVFTRVSAFEDFINQYI